jgi:hypothetical protein
MYSKPHLKLATLPCRFKVQAGLKWLTDIKKTSGRRYKSCLPKKETWLTHLFSAMGVPGDTQIFLAPFKLALEDKFMSALSLRDRVTISHPGQVRQADESRDLEKI